MQNSDPLSWLLANDLDNPGIRYFALRELLEKPENDPELRAARYANLESRPIGEVESA